MKYFGLLLVIIFCGSCRTGFREIDLHKRPSSTYFHFNSWGTSPSLEGGLQAWATHIEANRIDLPAQCKEGRVMVSFKVTRTGQMDSAYVSQGLCEPADRNALEIARTSGPWKPAVKDSLVQDSWVTLPIMYRYPKRR